MALCKDPHNINCSNPVLNDGMVCDTCYYGPDHERRRVKQEIGRDPGRFMGRCVLCGEGVYQEHDPGEGHGDLTPLYGVTSSAELVSHGTAHGQCIIDHGWEIA